MSPVKFNPRIMSRFVETLSAEIGRDTYHAVLSKSNLSNDWQLPEFFITLDPAQSAESYARLQAALRAYYGRGARGILMRIGTKLWEPMLKDAPLATRAQIALVRNLPKSMRRKPALDLLVRLLSSTRGDVTLHPLDLDLLLVDHASPTTLGQTDDVAICHVTFGLIRECLYWATGEEHDIEERVCKASGSQQCEFTITIGTGS